jgi:hypothetical protein
MSASRRGKNTPSPLADLFHPSVCSRLPGYEEEHGFNPGRRV